MSQQQRKGAYNTYEDDADSRIADEASEPVQRGAPARIAAPIGADDEERIGNHMGGDRIYRQEHLEDEETRVILVTGYKTLEQLESGDTKIEIGEAAAQAFRRVHFNKESSSIVHSGDVGRAQVTRSVVRAFTNELPVDVGVKFHSAKGELNVNPVLSKVAPNGRSYPLVMKRNQELMLSILKQFSSGVTIYENSELIDDYLIKTYGSTKAEDIRVGITPHPTDSSYVIFDYRANKLVAGLLKKHAPVLEQEFERFSYADLQFEANRLGHATVQVPSEVIDKIEGDITQHAIGAIDEGTGHLAHAGVQLEWTNGAGGSFKGVRQMMMKKSGLDASAVDQLMHQVHQIDLELVVSAVIPGVGPAHP